MIAVKPKLAIWKRQIEKENAGIHPLQQKGRTGRNEEGTLVIDSKGTFVNDKEGSNNFDLEKENHELRQQLAQVQAELAKVLVELKKLTGKGDEKLEQQQAENEKAIKQGSVAEIKAQMQKSQALMREAGTQTKESTPEKSKPGNGALPYLAVGSLLAVGLGGIVYWWKKHSSRK